MDLLFDMNHDASERPLAGIQLSLGEFRLETNKRLLKFKNRPVGTVSPFASKIFIINHGHLSFPIFSVYK